MSNLQQSMTTIRNLLNMTFFRVLLFVLLGVAMYFSMYSNVKPEKLDLSLFSVAEQTIRSPITIEDKASTERKRKEAENNVKDIYVVKKEIAQNRVDLVTSIFGSVSEVNEEVKEGLEEKKKSAANESDKDVEAPAPSTPSPEDKLSMVKEKLTEDVTREVSDGVFLALLQAKEGELSIAKDLTVTAINKIMNNEIPAEQVENAKKRVEEELKFTSLNSEIKKPQ